jgi:hypothetical protein
LDPKATKHLLAPRFKTNIQFLLPSAIRNNKLPKYLLEYRFY